MATVQPVLYSTYRSSCVWRVRIALALKGIEYEPVTFNLYKGEQDTDEFLQLNPMKQVPALVIDGISITQSIAIIEYLEETRPSPSILPSDPKDRAKARMIAETIASGIQPQQNLGVLRRFDEDKRRPWAKHFIDKGFQAVERMLSQTAGKYCVGDSVSIADLCLVPQVYHAYRFKVDMSKFLIIARINEELSKLDAFRQAHPRMQPDCPEDQK